MNLTPDTIEKILEISSKFTIEKLDDGREYKIGPNGILKLEPPVPETISFKTLSAMVDYINWTAANAEDRTASPAKTFIHIAGFREVMLRTGLMGAWLDRYTLAVSSAVRNEYPYGQYLDAKDFVVHLQTCFKDTPVRTELLKAFSNVASSSIKISKDDGISEEIEVRQTITRSEAVELRNPIILKPFVTFSEIEQPDVPYILRMKAVKPDDPDKDAGSVKVMIERTYDNQWQLETLADIRAFFEEKIGQGDLPDIQIIS